MRYLLCTAAFGAAAFAVGCTKLSEPTVAEYSLPQKPIDIAPQRDTWTHAELMAHLQKQGVKVRAVSTDFGSFFGPSNFIVKDDSPYKEGEPTAEAFRAKKPRIVHCQLRKTAQEAKDEAGAGGGKWASGRFLFEGDSAIIEQIRKALG